MAKPIGYQSRAVLFLLVYLCVPPLAHTGHLPSISAKPHLARAVAEGRVGIDRMDRNDARCMMHNGQYLVMRYSRPPASLPAGTCNEP
jgi:hypothetical protein